MPSDAFQFLSDADMADMISYVRSLPRKLGRDTGRGRELAMAK